MIGIDTGFFVELIKGNKQTLKVWNEIISRNSSKQLYKRRNLSEIRITPK
jgi:hypothetical protein